MIQQFHPWVYIQKTKTEILIQKDPCTSTSTETLFIIAKTREQLKSPAIDEKIEKMWCTYTMEYYSGIKKGEI